MPWRPRRRAGPPPAVLATSCQVAREAISALADGETAPIAETVVAAHLARCRECEEFRAGVLSLRRRLRVRALAGASHGADELVELLFGTADADSPRPRPTLARPFAGRHRLPWLRASQWAAGVAPLALAVPLLASGVFAHVHVVPSPFVAPCTAGLRHALRP